MKLKIGKMTVLMAVVFLNILFSFTTCYALDKPKATMVGYDGNNYKITFNRSVKYALSENLFLTDGETYDAQYLASAAPGSMWFNYTAGITGATISVPMKYKVYAYYIDSNNQVSPLAVISPSNFGALAPPKTSSSPSTTPGSKGNNSRLPAAWQALMTEYRYLVSGITAIGTLTSVLIFIIHSFRLATLPTHPRLRREAIMGIVVSAISTALLGSVTLVLTLFYNIIFL